MNFGSLLKFLILIVSEFLAARQRDAAAEKAAQDDREMWNGIASRAVDRLRDWAPKEAKQAQDVEDQVDAELGKSQP